MKKIVSLFLLFISGFSVHAQTTAVGSIEGAFNVSDLGAANYTIPIKVPDGVGGMQPGLSIVYSSQGGNGIMGMGWSLSGSISAISRTPSTIYNDKKVAGVSLTAEDRFALDGQRLIGTAGTYGADNAIYHTEIESFKEVKSFGSLGSGPMSFVVTDQNGTKYEYGTKTISRPTVPGKAEPYMWLLDKVTDINGNYMEFGYQYYGGEEPCISLISYTGNVNTGAQPKSIISFNYESRPDPNFNYVAGGKIIQHQRLKNIYVQQKDTLSNAYTVHSYVFQYTLDQYSHLTKIFEKGHSIHTEPEVLNPTEMLYQDDKAPVDVQTDATVGAWKNSDAITGDFNGDGFSDVIRYANQVQTGNIVNMAFHLYLNNGNGGLDWAQNSAFISEDYDGYYDQVGKSDLFSLMGFGKEYYRASTSNNLPFDVNGDGFEDIVYKQSFTGEYPTSATGFSDEAKSREVYSIYYSNGNTIGNSRVVKPMPNRSFYETTPTAVTNIRMITSISC